MEERDRKAGELGEKWEGTRKEGEREQEEKGVGTRKEGNQRGS